MRWPLVTYMGVPCRSSPGPIHGDVFYMSSLLYQTWDVWLGFFSVISAHILTRINRTKATVNHIRPLQRSQVMRWKYLQNNWQQSETYHAVNRWYKPDQEIYWMSLVVGFPDNRFVHLFRTKMTRSSSFFVKTYSLLTEYPNITATLTARSAGECGLICMIRADKCQHFHYIDRNGTESGTCLVLVWTKEWFRVLLVKIIATRRVIQCKFTWPLAIHDWKPL